MMTRRTALQIPLLAAAANLPKETALSLNEDNSHYFFTRAGQTFTPESVASFVDQYAGTQVRELILSANSQRTSFASKVWDPIWKGYDPQGSDDQPLFASTPKDGRASARKWTHTAWQMHSQGIDPYALWIRRAREKKLRPWISMRMNDLHNVDDPQSYMHSTFWREHPEYRRVGWRTPDWRDRAFDFNHAAVRDHHFQLVEEYCERYDFDGLELDWMRFGFHFKPGEEQRGNEASTEFVRRTRALLNRWEKKRGHKIALGARVPTRPQTAWAMGMDGARWASEGLLQMLVVTPFWASIETEIPIEQWRRLIGPNVILAAGLELLIRPYHEYKIQMNTLETVRGAAAGFLARGADRVYLFNYMDSQTAMPDIQNYGAVLRECGSLNTLQGKPRRHVVTYSDTWAPGEAQGAQLPKTVRAGGWASFRLFVGQRLNNAKLRMEVLEPTEVHLNGAEQALRQSGEVMPGMLTPGPVTKAREWMLGAVEGWLVFDVRLPNGGTIHWVEVGNGERLQSQARADFSGIWKLNLQRSGPVMPRNLQSLSITIEHRDPQLRMSETRTVAGKTTQSDEIVSIDGVERVESANPSKVSKTRLTWIGGTIQKDWELTENGTTYTSNIWQRLTDGGKTLIMSEDYREPGMTRIRDWVFEKQEF